MGETPPHRDVPSERPYDHILKSDSRRTPEASQIEPREAFRIEEAVNLHDLPAHNREPHHHERPLVGHDDNSRGAVDEHRNLDGGGLRRGERRTRHFCRSSANQRQCTALFPAIRSQHHIGIQHRHERVEVAAVRRREEGIDDLSLTREVGVWSRHGCTLHVSPRTAGELSCRGPR